jgi:hypothetical protein
MNTGIDYGFGKTNINTETKIRFGVIPVNDVCEAWCDSSEPEYSNACPHCGNEPKSGNSIHDMCRCPSCYKPLTDSDFDFSEPVCNTLDSEYKAYDDSTGDIFILLSPYYTYAQFCSPCAPGACYLRSPLDEKIENNKAYCFNHDFFYSGKAPYTVYSVETNEEVRPEDV